MPKSVRPSQGESLTLTAIDKQTTAWHDGLLGALCFTNHHDENPLSTHITAPHSCIAMQRLDAPDTAIEVWHGDTPLQQGHRGAMQFRHNAEVLFGIITLHEVDFIATPHRPALQQAAESGYGQIFTLLDELDYPCLFRFWNYMADINGQSEQLERYRQFNLGRQEAFLSHGRDIDRNVPAACALGASEGPLSISFLAGRQPPRAIENPRQVSAYQYPQQYGPRSPTFSRASLVTWGREEVLFISGTASIIGHSTMHLDDVAAQTRETMANIEAVLRQANLQAQQPGFDLSRLHYKIYIRHSADLPQVKHELEHIIGCTPDACYLQADICRKDLLVEIEATASQPLALSDGESC